MQTYQGRMVGGRMVRWIEIVFFVLFKSGSVAQMSFMLMLFLLFSNSGIFEP